jgi:two-component system, NtrC family, sensor kinase
LRESLEQQTTIADTLKLIARSSFDLQAVLDALVASAARLCEADMAAIVRPQGEGFYYAASHGFSPEFIELARRAPIYAGRGTLAGRTVLERRIVQIPDAATDPEYSFAEARRVAGFRTMLGVPLLVEAGPIGVIVLARSTVRPFTDKQIEVASTFADQAVIAIENVRLFGAVQQRTLELAESLEQQTATSEVLRVISSSPGELEPVFHSILSNAIRLCGAEFGNLFLWEEEGFRAVAMHGAPRAYAEAWRRDPVISIRDHPYIPLAQVDRSKDIVHIADIAMERAAGRTDSRYAAMYDEASARTMLLVPMLKGAELIGAIVIYGKEVRPYTEKQIEVVTAFAKQAVIAVENSRLLNELRHRTDDLSESLAQQTATADVLKTISRSAFDLKSVLQTLVESAAQLCDADKATITRQQGGVFFRAEAYGFSQEFIDYVRTVPIEPERGSVIGRALLEGRVIHIPDVEADPEYTFTEAQRLGGFRTMIGVPMLRDGVAIGVLALTRSVVRPFTDKQIELLSTFADQAAIAIENVRLFDEIQEKSRQLAEASQFLANMSHELRTPLNAILGYTELILDNIYGETPEKMRGVLQRIESNGKHLLSLINDVLDLSKIEAGQLTLSLSEYSLKNVVQTVFSAVEPLAAEKRIDVDVDIAQELPRGHGDERRLTQVLLNLVGNAIKFTDAGKVSIVGSSLNGTFNVARHRPRHFHRRPGQAVSGISAGRQFDNAQE